MKKIRRIAENPITICLVLSNFLFVSCSRDNLAVEGKEDIVSSKSINTKALQRIQLDGEGLFRQVFFLQGGDQNILKDLTYYEVNILNIEKLSVTEKEQREKFINELVSLIKQNDPTYFDRFQRIIAGDDPYEIDNAIKVGGEKILETIDKTSYGAAYQKAMTIYEEKYGTKEITNPEEFETIKNEIAKALQADTSISNGEQGIALAAFVAVAAVALETVAVANMIAYLSVFIKVKGKVLKATDDIGLGKTASSLMNEEIVMKLIENY